MCWSPEASAGFAVAGVVAAAYAYKKKESPILWVPVLYFALMEVLQLLSYPVAGQCFSSQNQLLTMLSYVHIAFQPFFMNMIALNFVPSRVRAKIWKWVMLACVPFTAILLARALPLPIDACRPELLLCGTNLCTEQGVWHLAWYVPLNNFMPYVNAYGLSVFLLPLLYGSWRAVAFSLITGPLAARLFTDNINEQAAIWCFFSVGLILLMLFSPLRKWLEVTSWPLWPKKWKR